MGLSLPYKHAANAGQECGIGSSLAELLPKQLPTTPVSAASWKHRHARRKRFVPAEALETLFLAGYLH